MSTLKQKLEKANKALTFVNHIQYHLESENYPKTTLYPKTVICKICNGTINEISIEENKNPVTQLIKVWLQQNKIDTNPETTKLIGAEIYNAEIINAFMDEKLLGDLEK